MASIKKLGNNKYRVFLCNGFKDNGKVNRMSKVIIADSRKDAEKQAEAMEVDFRRGDIKPVHEQKLVNIMQNSQVDLSDYTFSTLVEKWRKLVKPDMEHKTQERYEGFLTGFMVPYFGNTKVREIRPLNILEYLSSLKEDGIRKDGKSGGYSEKTIRHHYALIHSLLEFAVGLEWIEYNTCDKVKPPKVRKHIAKYYDDENIERLLDCLEDEYNKTVDEARGIDGIVSFDNLTSSQRTDIFNSYMRKTYILVALISACRRGELVGLKVDNIDFKYNRIVVTQTGHYTVNQGIYFVDHLKNDEPIKNIDMPILMMEQLKEYIQVRTAFIKLMGWEDSSYLFISLMSGKVTTAGGPMMPDVISQWFSKFLERNNLPKITLHEVRHTSISYLINKGVDIKKVADRAGHQNTRTTEEIYGHVYDKTKRATADVYNDLFSSIGDKGK